jgi:hypothetical protein
MLNLTFVGSSHLDFRGPGRLKRFFENNRDFDTVAVELDQYRVRMLASLKHPSVKDQVFSIYYELFNEPNSETLSKYLDNVGFEFFESQKYADMQGISVELIDTGFDNVRIEDRFKNPKSGLHKSFKRQLKMSPKNLRRDVETHYWKNYEYSDVIDEWSSVDLKNRDKTMEENLRKLDGKVAVVGGLRHIFGSYGNLYDRFEDITRTRIKLNEV